MCYMKDRNSFSRYVYKLHEVVNKMLGKKSGLSYCDVRERYEHFRARCTEENQKFLTLEKSKERKRVYRTIIWKKAKCVINIVPQETKCKTLQIDKKCIKTR